MVLSLEEKYERLKNVVVGLSVVVAGIFGILVAFAYYTDELILRKDRVMQFELDQLRQEVETKSDMILHQDSRIRELEEVIIHIKDLEDSILGVMLNKDKKLARAVRVSSKSAGIDPILLTVLINSESSFKYTNHKHRDVKGLSAIHTRYHNYDLSTPEKQIYAGAQVLKTMLERSNGDVIEGLTRYKGVSDLGRRQARYVYDLYINAKGINNG